MAKPELVTRPQRTQPAATSVHTEGNAYRGEQHALTPAGLELLNENLSRASLDVDKNVMMVSTVTHSLTENKSNKEADFLSLRTRQKCSF